MQNNIFNECLEKYLSDAKNFWSDLACKHGYKSGESLRIAFKDERKRRGIPCKNQGTEVSDSYYDSYEQKSDGTVISDKLIEICTVDLKNPDKVLQAHGFDATYWDIIAYKHNLWHGSINGGGNIVKYQSKVTVKPKNNALTLQHIDDFLKKYTGGVVTTIKPDKIEKTGLLYTLEIDLADLHIGKEYLFDKCTSITDRVNFVIDDIIERAYDFNISKIYLVNLGDLLHFDTYNRTTSKGTQIESNLDIYEIFDMGVSLLTDIIAKLSVIAPVEFISVFGNHDKITTYMIAKTIEAFYKDNTNISVDTERLSRKYRQIGDNLVYWVHGDIPKKNLYNLLQKEARFEFGQSKYAEIHAGHLHTQQTIESGGVIIRYLPSVCDTDLWHFEKGYTGNLQTATSFLWHEEDGLREIWFSNIK